MGIEYFDDLPDMGTTELKWSNPAPPPTIGQRVHIPINGIGDATVLRYFTQEGYLGVVTKVDKWPDSFNNDASQECHAFGAELSYETGLQ